MLKKGRRAPSLVQILGERTNESVKLDSKLRNFFEPISNESGMQRNVNLMNRHAVADRLK